MNHLALLRGINVGGQNSLPMKDLVDLFEAAGATSVRTYIQSGNVVFEAAPEAVETIAAKVFEAIEERFDILTPIILRTAGEWERAIANCPYVGKGFDLQRVQVGFLRETPSAAAVVDLDPDRSPGDRFAVRGREIYVYCPDGFGRSKLTNAWFDRELGTVSTFRNWNTVLKLREMAPAD